MSDLHGQAALVTGASRGIGAAVARRLTQAGARVALHGRDEAALRALSEELPDSVVLTGDLRERTQAKVAADAALDAFGHLDILIANAGGSHAPLQPIEDITDDAWDANLDGNLGATFRTVRAVLPSMKAAGRGRIITIGSSAGRNPGDQSPVAYGVAKSAIAHFTQSLAAQAGPFGIRAACVAPAMILTERNRQHIPPGTLAAIAATCPLGRVGTPEDVAEAVLWLASDEAGWVSGVVLDVSGAGILR